MYKLAQATTNLHFKFKYTFFFHHNWANLILVIAQKAIPVKSPNKIGLNNK